MNTFFNTLKKTLIATIFVMFGLVATYVPQTWDSNKNIDTVHAGRATASLQAAALPHQLKTSLESTFTTIQATLSAAYDAITSWAGDQLWYKEYVLDGIAWSLGKEMVSGLTNDMVSYIQSGFEGGNPGFVTDLQSFITDAGDLAITNYLNDPFRGPSSYLCEPFENDIKQAVIEQHILDRDDLNVSFGATGGNGSTGSSCDLSIFNNDFETFISGAPGSFGEGGWQDFLTIVTNPEAYTAYGSYLATQASADAVVTKAQSAEVSVLNFGNGFNSVKICETISGALGDIVDCSITTPGKAIQEALSFNLDSGRQSLIAADEFSEVLGQLLTQLSGRVFSGAGGLLGLSGVAGQVGTGFDSSSYTPVAGANGTVVEDALSIRPQTNKTSLEIEQLTEMEIELRTQNGYLEDIIQYRSRLNSINFNTWSNTFLLQNPTLITPSYNMSAYNSARTQAINETNQVIGRITSDIAELEVLVSAYDAPAATSAQRANLWNSYLALEPTLYSSTEYVTNISSWSALVN